VGDEIICFFCGSNLFLFFFLRAWDGKGRLTKIEVERKNRNKNI